MSQSMDIEATPAAVWAVIADIEHCADHISGIESVEVVERPQDDSLVGFKWQETRIMFGKAATETMWVTDAEEPRFYETRAESHGSVYKSRMAIEETETGDCTLTMSFEGTPQTVGAKIMWALTGWMATKPMRKTIIADLEDIKAAAESAAA